MPIGLSGRWYPTTRSSTAKEQLATGVDAFAECPACDHMIPMVEDQVDVPSKRNPSDPTYDVPMRMLFIQHWPCKLPDCQHTDPATCVGHVCQEEWTAQEVEKFQELASDVHYGR
jgi:hypothetical protein